MLIISYDYDQHGVRAAYELINEYLRQEQEWCEQYPAMVLGMPTGFEPKYFAEYVILTARDRILQFGDKYPKLEPQIMKESERILHRTDINNKQD